MYRYCEYNISEVSAFLMSKDDDLKFVMYNVRYFL